MTHPKSFEDFRELAIWVGHDAKKFPRTPRTGALAKMNDPATWGTLAETEKLIAANDDIKGRGIALGQEVAPGLALYALDLDGCRDPNTGAYAPHVKAIIETVDSLVEVSPSRTGLKIFFMAEPGIPGRVFSPGKGKELKFMGAGSYSTVTGDLTDANGSPREIVELISDTSIHPVSRDGLDWILNVAGPAYKAGEAVTASPSKDESRSGYAFRLACKLKSRGRSEADFHAAIAADTGPAGDWWNDPDTSERDRRRVWERATAAPDMPDLDALTGAMPSGAERGLTLTPFENCSPRSGERYLVKGKIAPGDLGCIFGQPGTGKSVIGPLISYRLANGQRVFNSKVIEAGVFYVAAEDPYGMERRFVGLRRHYGGDQGPTLVTGIHDLTKPAQFQALADAIKAANPGLVIIDTLADSFGGIDENSAESMGYVVKAGRALTRLGPAVIFVHHTTKADGGTPRGHSVFNGALDFSMQLQAADASGIVRGQLLKNRNGPCDQNIAFRILSVTIGVDLDGDAITAATGEEVDRPPNAAPKLPASAQAAFDELNRLFADAPVEDGVQRVACSDWQEACVASPILSGSEDRANRRRVFNRVLKQLVAIGLVDLDGEFAIRTAHTFGSLDRNDAQ